MALKVSLSAEETGLGLPAPECYVRIENICFTDPHAAMFMVQFFFSAEAWGTEGTRPLKTTSYSMTSFDHEIAQSPKNQLYNYLKTLPEFHNYADV